MISIIRETYLVSFEMSFVGTLLTLESALVLATLLHLYVIARYSVAHRRTFSFLIGIQSTLNIFVKSVEIIQLLHSTPRKCYMATFCFADN